MTASYARTSGPIGQTVTIVTTLTNVGSKSSQSWRHGCIREFETDGGPVRRGPSAPLSLDLFIEVAPNGACPGAFAGDDASG